MLDNEGIIRYIVKNGTKITGRKTLPKVMGVRM
jgi:hypothetical protein